MKLKLTVAVALTLLSGIAHAQSSVTLYGIIDGGLTWQTSSAASFSSKAKNTGSIVRYKDGGTYTSFWGMKGVEDLGGGYNAIMQLQGGFDSGTGKMGLGDTGVAATSIFNMLALVGVSGPFGTVKVGRQYTPMYLALIDTDARHAEYFGSILTLLVGMNSAAGWVGASTNAAIGSIYDSNAIVYVSPKLAGVTVSLEYAPGGVAGSIQGNARESAVVQYDNFGLKLAAIYYNGHDTNPGATTVATGLANNRFMSLSALYTRGDFSVSASFSNGRNPANSSSANYDLISGGLAYQFTPAFLLSSGVYYMKDKNHSDNRSTEVALEADYIFSRATLVYADVGYVNNRGTMNQALEYGQPVAPGVGTTAAMIGIRHRF
ncbi:porin [Burkholderia sp. LMG 32019]|uniref:porin n=1 Tax=Burkholderia sp. LMG 32019 TaxID=3158173 RepID=UPI003C306218